MDVNGKKTRTIWLHEPGCVRIIDQRNLPHEFILKDLTTVDDFAAAIRDMHVRGAPLIGATAAFGLYIACCNASRQEGKACLTAAYENLLSTRPTAVDLKWALDQMLPRLLAIDNPEIRTDTALKLAQTITDESAEMCRNIGIHGVKIIRDIYQQKLQPVNILTHCNAGWLACVDYGTATAPMYAAQSEGIPIHVWVDETRPRNQGARLTAWELGQQGIPHTVIADNTGGHLMQHDQVDLVLVGSDRTTGTGYAANKIGTYLKALAAHHNRIPFYVAVPVSSIDWNITDGIRDIPIEERSSEEVKFIQGRSDGKLCRVLLTPAESPAANYAFDVTPPELITGIITERGISAPNELRKLYD